MKNITTEALIQKREEKPCNHPTLIREHAYGGPTGNFICLECECLISPGMKQQSQIQPILHYVRKQADYPLRLPFFIA